MDQQSITRRTEEGKGPERDLKFDNMRVVLIFLVVFGHLVGAVKGRYADALYTAIYAFHMPAFILITGYFAKYRPKKILRHFVVPYFVFQTLYLLFRYFIVQDRGRPLYLHYTTPEGLLWFLMTVTVYYLLLPFLKTERKGAALAVIGGSAVLAVAAGFDSSVASYLSLSRIVVFFPFFAAGYYLATVFNFAAIRAWLEKHRLPVLVSTLAALDAGVYLLLRLRVKRLMLLGMAGYEAAGSGPAVRILLGVCALLGIAALFLLVPNKRIPYLTVIGAYTMPIYLLHGFIQRLLIRCEVFHFSQPVNLALAFAISCAIVAAFGNRYVGKLFRKIF